MRSPEDRPRIVVLTLVLTLATFLAALVGYVLLAGAIACLSPEAGRGICAAEEPEVFPLLLAPAAMTFLGGAVAVHRRYARILFLVAALSSLTGLILPPILWPPL